MKQMTISTLFKHLAKLIKEDPSIASKYIIVADDEEGNGYHGLYYGITNDAETIKECIEYSNGISDSDCQDLSKLVILG